MRLYKGSCHCGAIRFEIDTELTGANQCNCSICTKKGALHHRVPAENFRLLSGKDALSLYQFGTQTAKHWFCSHCGIHPFSNSRLAPDQYSINIRCLENFDQLVPDITINHFDGQNWEEAAAALRAKQEQS